MHTNHPSKINLHANQCALLHPIKLHWSEGVPATSLHPSYTSHIQSLHTSASSREFSCDRIYKYTQKATTPNQSRILNSKMSGFKKFVGTHTFPLPLISSHTH